MVTESCVQEKSIVANLGEIKVSGDPETVLSCLGVGSCIALCMYDPEAKIAGIAHIVLPKSNDSARSRENATKYADIAIPELLQEMRRNGAVRSRLVTKIAGGSQMFKAASTNNFDTGTRNIESVRTVLAEEAIKIDGEDVGGNKGRTVRMFVGEGKVQVKSVGGPAKEI
ncbi:MAG: chemotaxis protein CheD [Chloroflexi bacterium]|nr:chemotaxis protein CheD [Chloroflexota bacterium]